ncbi:HTH_48 domain-containing protein [Trichonephila clavipes]|nr:HTH_48 domain-containing protein [Trichonephila clavipes]
MEVTSVEQRACIKIAVLRGRNAIECHSELVDAIGNNALPYRTVSRWVGKFQQGRVPTSDEQRSRRPVTHRSLLIFHPVTLISFPRLKNQYMCSLTATEGTTTCFPPSSLSSAHPLFLDSRAPPHTHSLQPSSRRQLRPPQMTGSEGRKYPSPFRSIPPPFFTTRVA